MNDDHDSEESEPRPPSAAQVARRALILTVVACRGILELDPARDEAREFWDEVVPWWKSIGLDADLEPEEADLLSTPFGSAQRQSAVDAGWRSEALAVLGWALQRSSLPAHDTQVDASSISRQLGFLQPQTVLASPELRLAAELTEYANVAFTVHWRLRDFRLQPRALDFANVCETARFGPLSLRGVRLLNGDLAVGDFPISQALPASVGAAASIARERHQAANWLLDASLPLSETDAST
ncbi:MAG TPA: DUF4272 domain-containing protein [Polyangiaceae bacterium]|nr:DUF4272 domain-containing protein [Polyangiaceae bacterium]